MGGGYVGQKQVQLSRQAYYASVGFVDEWIGNILSKMESLGLTEKTFIIIRSRPW